MIHRAYALSSTTEAFNHECTSLHSIFTRLYYPLAMINSTITKTIQSFSSGTREKNKEDGSVVRVSWPFKNQTSANDWHYTITYIYQQKITLRLQHQRNKAFNCKSTAENTEKRTLSSDSMMCTLYV